MSNPVEARLVNLYCPVYERLMQSDPPVVTDKFREEYGDALKASNKAMKPLIEGLDRETRAAIPYGVQDRFFVPPKPSSYTTFRAPQHACQPSVAGSFNHLASALRPRIFGCLLPSDLLPCSSVNREWSQEMPPYLQRHLCRDAATLCHSVAMNQGLEAATRIHSLVDETMRQKCRTGQEYRWNHEKLRRMFVDGVGNRLSTEELSAIDAMIQERHDSPFLPAIKDSIILALYDIARIAPHEYLQTRDVLMGRVNSLLDLVDELIEKGNYADALGILDFTSREFAYLRPSVDRLILNSKIYCMKDLMLHDPVIGKELILDEMSNCWNEKEILNLLKVIIEAYVFYEREISYVPELDVRTKISELTEFKEQALAILFNKSLRLQTKAAFEVAKAKKTQQMECFDALLAECERQGNDELYNEITDYLHTPRS